VAVTDEYRDNVLLPWLAANGIDAGLIPADGLLSFTGDHLTVQMLTFREDGTLVTDGDGRPLRTVRTFPITVPLPEGAAESLRPKCRTCGR
jgi:hypothetical protein